MRRSATLALIVLGALATAAWGQDTAPPPARQGVSVLYEAAIGTRLNRQVDPGVDDVRWFASWDLGLMAQHGDRAWGATLLAHADEDGSRWGIRPRYRQWLGRNTAIDLGAGILFAGTSGSAVRQSYPGFTGLVALSHGHWLGLSLEVQAVRTTQVESFYFDPVLGEQYQPGASTVDWGIYLGARLNGVGALVASAAELVLGIAAAASMGNMGM